MKRRFFRLSAAALLVVQGFYGVGASSQALGRPQNTTIDLVQAKRLYSSGQYVEVADYLTPYLKQNPSDSKARAMLVLALVKLDEIDLAKTELKKLQSVQGDTRGAAYANQLEMLINNTLQIQNAKKGIYVALENYDAKTAENLINQLPYSDLHKNILLAYVSIYQGAFDSAEARLKAFAPETLADSRTLKQIDEQVAAHKQESTKLQADINSYLYSEVTSNVCNSFLMTQHGNYPRGGQFITTADFQRYVENVAKLNVLTPLNHQVMDLVFHVTMLGGDYKETEAVGDKLIRAKGTVRVPFLSTDSYFWVKIDGQNKRLSTEPNANQKFLVTVDYPALLPTDYTPLVLFHAAKIPHHSPQARWYDREEPFDFSLDQITSISQQAKDWRGGLQSKAYALKLSPSGLAPNYLLMNVLACVFGEEAQRRATRNLGLFIQHVALPQKLTVNLVDPSKHTVDIWGEGQFGSMIAGMYSATAAQYGTSADVAMASMVSQQMAQEEASKQQYDQGQRVASVKWFTEMKAIGETFQANVNVAEVEKLLELQ
jgi:hypothetical protein